MGNRVSAPLVGTEVAKTEPPTTLALVQEHLEQRQDWCAYEVERLGKLELNGDEEWLGYGDEDRDCFEDLECFNDNIKEGVWEYNGEHCNNANVSGDNGLVGNVLENGASRKVNGNLNHGLKENHDVKEINANNKYNTKNSTHIVDGEVKRLAFLLEKRFYGDGYAHFRERRLKEIQKNVAAETESRGEEEENHEKKNHGRVPKPRPEGEVTVFTDRNDGKESEKKTRKTETEKTETGESLKKGKKATAGETSLAKVRENDGEKIEGIPGKLRFEGEFEIRRGWHRSEDPDFPDSEPDLPDRDRECMDHFDKQMEITQDLKKEDLQQKNEKIDVEPLKSAQGEAKSSHSEAENDNDKNANVKHKLNDVSMIINDHKLKPESDAHAYQLDLEDPESEIDKSKDYEPDPATQLEFFLHAEYRSLFWESWLKEEREARVMSANRFPRMLANVDGEKQEVEKLLGWVRDISDTEKHAATLKKVPDTIVTMKNLEGTLAHLIWDMRAKGNRNDNYLSSGNQVRRDPSSGSRNRQLATPPVIGIERMISQMSISSPDKRPVRGNMQENSENTHMQGDLDKVDHASAKSGVSVGGVHLHEIDKLDVPQLPLDDMEKDMEKGERVSDSFLTMRNSEGFSARYSVDAYPARDSRRIKVAPLEESKNDSISKGSKGSSRISRILPFQGQEEKSAQLGDSPRSVNLSAQIRQSINSPSQRKAEHIESVSTRQPHGAIHGASDGARLPLVPRTVTPPPIAHSSQAFGLIKPSQSMESSRGHQSIKQSNDDQPDNDMKFTIDDVVDRTDATDRDIDRMLKDLISRQPGLKRIWAKISELQNTIKSVELKGHELLQWGEGKQREWGLVVVQKNIEKTQGVEEMKTLKTFEARKSVASVQPFLIRQAEKIDLLDFDQPQLKKQGGQIHQPREMEDTEMESLRPKLQDMHASFTNMHLMDNGVNTINGPRADYPSPGSSLSRSADSTMWGHIMGLEQVEPPSNTGSNQVKDLENNSQVSGDTSTPGLAVQGKDGPDNTSKPHSDRSLVGHPLTKIPLVKPRNQLDQMIRLSDKKKDGSNEDFHTFKRTENVIVPDDFSEERKSAKSQGVRKLSGRLSETSSPRLIGKLVVGGDIPSPKSEDKNLNDSMNAGSLILDLDQLDQVITQLLAQTMQWSDLYLKHKQTKPIVVAALESANGKGTCWPNQNGAKGGSNASSSSQQMVGSDWCSIEGDEDQCGNRLTWTEVIETGLPPQLQNDPDVIVAALKGNVIRWDQLTLEQKDNKAVALVAVRKAIVGWEEMGSEQDLPRKHRNDPDIIAAAFEEGLISWSEARDNEFRDLPEITIAGLKKGEIRWEDLSEGFRKSTAFVVRALKEKAVRFSELGFSVDEDEKEGEERENSGNSEPQEKSIQILQTSKNNNRVFTEQQKKEIVVAAVEFGAVGFSSLSEKQKKDRDILTAVVRYYGHPHWIISEGRTKDRKDVLFAALKAKITKWAELPPNLREDSELFVEALQRQLFYWTDMKTDEQKDAVPRYLVFAALKAKKHTLWWRDLSRKQRGDKQMVLAAMQGSQAYWCWDDFRRSSSDSWLKDDHEVIVTGLKNKEVNNSIWYRLPTKEKENLEIATTAMNHGISWDMMTEKMKAVFPEPKSDGEKSSKAKLFLPLSQRQEKFYDDQEKLDSDPPKKFFDPDSETPKKIFDQDSFAGNLESLAQPRVPQEKSEFSLFKQTMYHQDVVNISGSAAAKPLGLDDDRPGLRERDPDDIPASDDRPLQESMPDLSDGLMPDYPNFGEHRMFANGNPGGNIGKFGRSTTASVDFKNRERREASTAGWEPYLNSRREDYLNSRLGNPHSLILDGKRGLDASRRRLKDGQEALDQVQSIKSARDLRELLDNILLLQKAEGAQKRLQQALLMSAQAQKNLRAADRLVRETWINFGDSSTANIKAQGVEKRRVKKGALQLFRSWGARANLDHKRGFEKHPEMLEVESDSQWGEYLRESDAVQLTVQAWTSLQGWGHGLLARKGPHQGGLLCKEVGELIKEISALTTRESGADAVLVKLGIQLPTRQKNVQQTQKRLLERIDADVDANLDELQQAEPIVDPDKQGTPDSGRSIQGEKQQKQQLTGDLNFQNANLTSLQSPGDNLLKPKSDLNFFVAEAGRANQSGTSNKAMVVKSITTHGQLEAIPNNINNIIAVVRENEEYQSLENIKVRIAQAREERIAQESLLAKLRHLANFERENEIIVNAWREKIWKQSSRMWEHLSERNPASNHDGMWKNHQSNHQSGKINDNIGAGEEKEERASQKSRTHKVRDVTFDVTGRVTLKGDSSVEDQEKYLGALQDLTQLEQELSRDLVCLQKEEQARKALNGCRGSLRRCFTFLRQQNRNPTPGVEAPMQTEIANMKNANTRNVDDTAGKVNVQSRIESVKEGDKGGGKDGASGPGESNNILKTVNSQTQKNVNTQKNAAGSNKSCSIVENMSSSNVNNTSFGRAVLQLQSEFSNREGEEVKAKEALTSRREYFEEMLAVSEEMDELVKEVPETYRRLDMLDKNFLDAQSEEEKHDSNDKVEKPIQPNNWFSETSFESEKWFNLLEAELGPKASDGGVRWLAERWIPQSFARLPPGTLEGVERPVLVPADYDLKWEGPVYYSEDGAPESAEKGPSGYKHTVIKVVTAREAREQDRALIFNKRDLLAWGRRLTQRVEMLPKRDSLPRESQWQDNHQINGTYSYSFLDAIVKISRALNSREREYLQAWARKAAGFHEPIEGMGSVGNSNHVGHNGPSNAMTIRSTGVSELEATQVMEMGTKWRDSLFDLEETADAVAAMAFWVQQNPQEALKVVMHGIGGTNFQQIDMLNRAEKLKARLTHIGIHPSVCHGIANVSRWSATGQFAIEQNPLPLSLSENQLPPLLENSKPLLQNPLPSEAAVPGVALPNADLLDSKISEMKKHAFMEMKEALLEESDPQGPKLRSSNPPLLNLRSSNNLNLRSEISESLAKRIGSTSRTERVNCERESENDDVKLQVDECDPDKDEGVESKVDSAANFEENVGVRVGVERSTTNAPEERADRADTSDSRYVSHSSRTYVINREIGDIIENSVPRMRIVEIKRFHEPLRIVPWQESEEFLNWRVPGGPLRVPGLSEPRPSDPEPVWRGSQERIALPQRDRMGTHIQRVVLEEVLEEVVEPKEQMDPLRIHFRIHAQSAGPFQRVYYEKVEPRTLTISGDQRWRLRGLRTGKREDLLWVQTALQDPQRERRERALRAEERYAHASGVVEETTRWGAWGQKLRKALAKIADLRAMALQGTVWQGTSQSARLTTAPTLAFDRKTFEAFEARMRRMGIRPHSVARQHRQQEVPLLRVNDQNRQVPSKAQNGNAIQKFGGDTSERMSAGVENMQNLERRNQRMQHLPKQTLRMQNTLRTQNLDMPIQNTKPMQDTNRSNTMNTHGSNTITPRINVTPRVTQHQVQLLNFGPVQFEGPRGLERNDEDGSEDLDRVDEQQTDKNGITINAPNSKPRKESLTSSTPLRFISFGGEQVQGPQGRRGSGVRDFREMSFEEAQISPFAMSKVNAPFAMSKDVSFGMPSKNGQSSTENKQNEDFVDFDQELKIEQNKRMAAFEARLRRLDNIDEDDEGAYPAAHEESKYDPPNEMRGPDSREQVRDPDSRDSRNSKDSRLKSIHGSKPSKSQCQKKSSQNYLQESSQNPSQNLKELFEAKQVAKASRKKMASMKKTTGQFGEIDPFDGVLEKAPNEEDDFDQTSQSLDIRDDIASQSHLGTSQSANRTVKAPTGPSDDRESSPTKLGTDYGGQNYMGNQLGNSVGRNLRGSVATSNANNPTDFQIRANFQPGAQNNMNFQPGNLKIPNSLNQNNVIGTGTANVNGVQIQNQMGNIGGAAYGPGVMHYGAGVNNDKSPVLTSPFTLNPRTSSLAGITGSDKQKSSPRYAGHTNIDQINKDGKERARKKDGFKRFKTKPEIATEKPRKKRQVEEQKRPNNGDENGDTDSDNYPDSSNNAQIDPSLTRRMIPSAVVQKVGMRKSGVSGVSNNSIKSKSGASGNQNPFPGAHAQQEFNASGLQEFKAQPEGFNAQEKVQQDLENQKLQSSEDENNFKESLEDGQVSYPPRPKQEFVMSFGPGQQTNQEQNHQFQNSYFLSEPQRLAAPGEPRVSEDLMKNSEKTGRASASDEQVSGAAKSGKIAPRQSSKKSGFFSQAQDEAEDSEEDDVSNRHDDGKSGDQNDVDKRLSSPASNRKVGKGKKGGKLRRQQYFQKKKSKFSREGLPPTGKSRSFHSKSGQSKSGNSKSAESSISDQSDPKNNQGVEGQKSSNKQGPPNDESSSDLTDSDQPRGPGSRGQSRYQNPKIEVSKLNPGMSKLDLENEVKRLNQEVKAEDRDAYRAQPLSSRESPELRVDQGKGDSEGLLLTPYSQKSQTPRSPNKRPMNQMIMEQFHRGETQNEQNKSSQFQNLQIPGQTRLHGDDNVHPGKGKNPVGIHLKSKNVKDVEEQKVPEEEGGDEESEDYNFYKMGGEREHPGAEMLESNVAGKQTGKKRLVTDREVFQATQGTKLDLKDVTPQNSKKKREQKRLEKMEADEHENAKLLKAHKKIALNAAMATVPQVISTIHLIKTALEALVRKCSRTGSGECRCRKKFGADNMIVPKGKSKGNNGKSKGNTSTFGENLESKSPFQPCCLSKVEVPGGSEHLDHDVDKHNVFTREREVMGKLTQLQKDVANVGLEWGAILEYGVKRFEQSGE